MTPSGIEPATLRFVAQHLNHCATAVPHASILPFLYLVPPKRPQYLHVIPLHVEHTVAQHTFSSVALHRNSIRACTLWKFRCTNP